MNKANLSCSYLVLPGCNPVEKDGCYRAGQDRTKASHGQFHTNWFVGAALDLVVFCVIYRGGEAWSIEYFIGDV